MTLLIGVVLICSVLLWKLDSSWEWAIPQKWQAKLVAWKERFVKQTHVLYYECYLGTENRELENQLWHLQMTFPKLRKIHSPMRVEVCVHPNFSPEQNMTYISCLERRFPEIRIYQSLLGERDRTCVSTTARVERKGGLHS